MFISSKKTYEFPNPDFPDKKVTIPAEYLGPVDDWVTDTLLFKLAVKEGSITMVGHEKSIPVTPAVSNEEKELREKARALNIENADELPLIGLALLVYEAENSRGSANDETKDDDAPADGDDLVARLEAMDLDALKALAAMENISLGNATTEAGIRKKILDAFK